LSADRPVLVCFALPEEAAPFRRARVPSVEVLVTGMGPRNTEWALQRYLEQHQPRAVFTCGFAGGLKPELSPGAVVFDADTELAVEEPLRQAGAIPGRIHCSARVVITCAEKRALREETQADAVEMESGIIRQLCRARGIPSATVRVITDTANEDLPIDFNQVLTADHRIHPGKLAAAILKAPSKIPALLRFQRCCFESAGRLTEVLKRVLSKELSSSRGGTQPPSEPGSATSPLLNST
jgi:adenosylhomocysteine nucleosidase